MSPMGTGGHTRLGLWPPLPPRALIHKAAGPAPFPLDQEGTRFYFKARQGLFHGVRALGLEPGDQILTPAYHQGAEIEAFYQAGLKMRYYDTTELLEPDSAQLKALLGPKVRALHIIHYWGFPQDLSRWRSWCDDHKLLLIEDGAQALLSTREGQAAGSVGDLAVFCLYKSFGLPDGAAAFCRAELPPPRSSAALGSGPFFKRLGSSLAQNSRLFTGLHRRLGGSDPTARSFGKFVKGEFELGDPAEPPSRLTSWAINRIVRQDAAARRHDNHQYLLERLEHLVPPAFKSLPAGAVPIGFPILCDDPQRLVAALDREHIDSGRIWATWHPTLDTSQFPVARFYRERVVAVPVHQELRRSDLVRIAETVARLTVPVT